MAGGGGGGGGGAPQQGEDNPQAQSGDPGGPRPQMSREAAEQLLEDAQERDLGLQREKLRKPQSPDPTTH